MGAWRNAISIGRIAQTVPSSDDRRFVDTSDNNDPSNTMPTMRFYMTPGSCSTGLHIILEELEETFEVYIVDLPAGDHFKPDYLAINPKATIPALVRPDGCVLTEVPAVAYWLARTHPRAHLWPDDVDGETRALETMSYVVGTVHGQGFARLFATSSFTRNGADHPDVQDLGRAIVEKGFAILEETLEFAPYAVGRFSVVDPVLFYVAFWADKLGISLPEKLAAHYRLMLTRPAVRRVLSEEGYNLDRLARQPAAAT